MFRASSVPIIRGYLLYTRQLVPFMQVMWLLPSRVRLEPARKRSHNLHERYELPCVEWITPEDGHRKCPKHVGFYDKINVGYWCIYLVIFRKLITMHGHLNINYEVCVYGTWLCECSGQNWKVCMPYLLLHTCRRRYFRLNRDMHNIIHSTHMWLTDRPLTDLEDRILCIGKLVYRLKKYCFDGTQRLIKLFTKSCDWVHALF